MLESSRCSLREDHYDFHPALKVTVAISGGDEPADSREWSELCPVLRVLHDLVHVPLLPVPDLGLAH